MVKTDIAEHLCRNLVDLTRAEALSLVDLVMGEIKGRLAGGEDVLISGFGKFNRRYKKARQGRNPQTGEPLTLAARTVVTFTPSQVLKNITTVLAE